MTVTLWSGTVYEIPDDTIARVVVCSETSYTVVTDSGQWHCRGNP